MYKWVKILEFTTFYQNALNLSSMYYATFYERMSHRRAILVFHVGSSEPSEPIKCSDRVLFEVGGVLLNPSFGNTPWFDSTCLGSAQVDESLIA